MMTGEYCHESSAVNEMMYPPAYFPPGDMAELENWSSLRYLAKEFSSGSWLMRTVRTARPALISTLPVRSMPVSLSSTAIVSVYSSVRSVFIHDAPGEAVHAAGEASTVTVSGAFSLPRKEQETWLRLMYCT